MTRDITLAVLHTGNLTEEKLKGLCPESTAADIRNLAKIYALMDGQTAILLPSLSGDGGYTFCGLADKGIDREISYLFEQDSTFGSYINQREEFDKAYASGGYDREMMFCLSKELVEVVPEETWLALSNSMQGD